MWLDISHRLSALVVYGALVWEWMGRNVSAITATCAIIGLLVNIVTACIKWRRSRYDGN